MARYREIAATLREEIESGARPPGALLPGLADLVQRFNASRVTVRTAIGVLEAGGLVRVVQGRGTEVIDQRAVRVRLTRYAAAVDPAATLGPWEIACERVGVAGAMRYVDLDRLRAPADVATALLLPADAPVVRRDRHAMLDGRSVQLQTAWYPLEVVAGTPLAHARKVTGGAYAALIAAGVTLDSATESVGARGATAEEAAELHTREGAPVLTVERLTRDVHGNAVELLRVVAHPGRTVLVYDDLPLH